MKRVLILFNILMLFTACVSNVTNRDLSTDSGLLPGDSSEQTEVGLSNDAGQNPAADYPDAEPLVRILSPGADGYANSMGSTVAIAGLVFGKVDELYLIGPKGKRQELSGAPYWVSEAVELSPGDNRIRVYAKSESGLVSDTITVVYTPNIYFKYAPKIEPPALFVGEKTVIHATIKAPTSTLLDLSTLKLVRCDAAGQPVQDEGRMLDDGRADVSGDEIQKDGVYSLQFSTTCKQAGLLYFRASVKVKAFADHGEYIAWSKPMVLECVRRLGTGACQDHHNLLIAAKQAYEAARHRGMSPLQAKAAAYDVLIKSGDVQQHGSADSPFGLWVRFKDGVLGAMPFPEPGIRGGKQGGQGDKAMVLSALQRGNRVLSNRVLVWSPISKELADLGIGDEGRHLNELIKQKQCPAFDVEGPWTNAAAKLYLLRRVSDYGVISLVAHGDAFFKGLPDEVQEGYGWSHKGTQEVIWSGQRVDCKHLLTNMTPCSDTSQCPTGSRCLVTSVKIEKDAHNRLVTRKKGVCYDADQVDLMRGRVVMGPQTYGILPAFISHYGRDGDTRSMVYLGGCRTMWNGSMAAAFLACGAQAVLGYNGYVTDEFAYETGSKLFDSMITKEDRIGVAAAQGGIDPIYHTRLMLFGTRWMDLSDYSMLDQDFEASRLLGWKQNGDARVISRLGKTGPIQGKKMAIISTGLGFTTDSGGLKQSFCLPPGATKIKFYWRFYSEEFKEFCGSPFQDTFKAVLSSPMAGEKVLVSVDIDDLCPKGIKPCDQKNGGSSTCKACTDCGSYWPDGKDHLTKADVRFDQGGVYDTPWQVTQVKLNGSLFSNPGKPVPVTLSFQAGDTGDSIYDTAILIDAVEIE